MEVEDMGREELLEEYNAALTRNIKMAAKLGTVEGRLLKLKRDHQREVEELKKMISGVEAAVWEDLHTRIATLEAEITKMKEHTWCAYCGLEIFIDDEAATKISEHIMACEKHPLHIALAANGKLREELESYKHFMRYGDERGEDAQAAIKEEV